MRSKKFNKDFPTHLYKYYTFNDYFKDILFKNEIYFSTPINFNDPFDRGIDLNFKIKNKNKLKKYLVNLVLQSKESLQGNELETNAEEFIDNNYELFDPNIDENEKNYRLNYISFVKRSGVCCFSEKKKNILMWSHYANKHRGFCVEFNFQKLNDALVSYNRKKNKYVYLQKVIYRKTYPQLSAINEDHMVDSLFIKSSDWKYESEWRAVYSEGNGEKLRLPKDVISAIYLGLELQDKEYTIIKDAMAKNKIIDSIYRAKKVKTKFSLKYERITM